jgi:hypothetical protein
MLMKQESSFFAHLNLLKLKISSQYNNANSNNITHRGHIRTLRLPQLYGEVFIKEYESNHQRYQEEGA